MYDNIKLIQYFDFQAYPEMLQEIKTRFSMKNENLNKGTCNNSGYSKLNQNKGLYISYFPTSGTLPEHIILQFSIHKFYNAINGRKLQNYDLFTCENAKEAFLQMLDFFPIDIKGAKIINYEVGLNLEMTKNPSDFMREITHIQQGKRIIRIIESHLQKEYKMFCSHSDQDKRAVYVFYDKTEESKPFAPANILRCEKKYNRLHQDVFFDNIAENSLFDDNFMIATKTDMRKAFVDNLCYVLRPVKEKGISKNDIIISEMIKKYGIDGTYNELKKQKQEKELGRVEYYRQKDRVKMYLENEKEIKTSVRNEAQMLKKEIQKKLSQI